MPIIKSIFAAKYIKNRRLRRQNSLRSIESFNGRNACTSKTKRRKKRKSVFISSANRCKRALCNPATRSKTLILIQNWSSLPTDWAANCPFKQSLCRGLSFSRLFSLSHNLQGQITLQFALWLYTLSSLFFCSLYLLLRRDRTGFCPSRLYKRFDNYRRCANNNCT